MALPAAAKNALLLVLVLALIGAASWFFSRGDPEAQYPDTADTKTRWVCVKCNKQIDLTAKQFNDWLMSAEMVRRDPSKGKQAVFKCSNCGTYTVCRAVYCSIHNVYFAECDPDGNILDCPLCEKAAAHP